MSCFFKLYNNNVCRHLLCNQVTTRDWRMTFLPQFQACVKAGAWSIMCSYNRYTCSTPIMHARIYMYVFVILQCIFHLHSINGIPACANKELLTDILKNEWAFQGKFIHVFKCSNAIDIPIFLKYTQAM